MNIFLAGIMQGSFAEARIHNQDWREPIKALLARQLPQAQVYCHYSRHRGSIKYEQAAIVETLEDGIRRAAECDLLVAWLPSASMGTAIEMYEACRHGAVVLTVTPLLANWVVRCYSDRIFPDLPALECFLASGEFAQLLNEKELNHKGHKEHEEKKDM